jgi:hypothetical protein
MMFAVVLAFLMGFAIGEGAARERPFWNRRATIGAFLCAGAITAAGFVSVMSWPLDGTANPFDNLAPNEWGDLFAGTFAALAFLWLVLTYMQQAEEFHKFSDLQDRSASAAEAQLSMETLRERPRFITTFATIGQKKVTISIQNNGGLAAAVRMTLIQEPNRDLIAEDAVATIGPSEERALVFDRPGGPLSNLELSLRFFDQTGKQWMHAFKPGERTGHPWKLIS